MKILLVHNHYGSSAPSGETKVVEGERALLTKFGEEVFEFYRYSDDIRNSGYSGLLKGAFSTPWNPFAAHAVKKNVEYNKPNVVHAHNTFPLISPSIFNAIGPRAARVLTLHNYRLVCPAAIPMRNNRVCTKCIDSSSVLPAIRYGCYRGSRLATVPLAVNVALHRRLGTWTNQVDAFIVLSEFQRELMISAGIPSDLVHVKPNFYPGNPEVIAWCKRPSNVVFAGRLTAEKGVESLVRAWIQWGESAPELRIVGDGDLRKKLETLAAKTPQAQIKFLGQLSEKDAQREISKAKMLVLPSEWFEGFPMVIREAFAFGTPVAVSKIGPLPSIVRHGENGLVFKPSNPESLLRTIKMAWDSKDALENLSLGARAAFEKFYTEDQNYQTLKRIYNQAIEVSLTRAQR